MGLVLVLATMTAPGCRGSASLPAAPQVPNSTGARLFSLEIESDATSVAVGNRLTLQAVGKDDRDTPIDVTPSWKSSDPAIATVSAGGVVSAVQQGHVTVTATIKSPPREATFELDVLKAGEVPTVPTGTDFPGDFADGDVGGALPAFPGPTGEIDTGMPGVGIAAPTGFNLTIYPQAPRVLKGERLRLVAIQGQSGSESPAAAVWRTLDPKIATVDEAGVVTGIKEGDVTITAASLAYPSLIQRTTLAVQLPAPSATISGIRIKPSKVQMNVGETFWLLAEVPTRSGGLDADVRWESGDSGIVTVSETGQITGVKPGKTTITAIAASYLNGELAATIPVEVRNAAGKR